MKFSFILGVVWLIHAVVVVIISMIHTQNCVFLMLLKACYYTVKVFNLKSRTSETRDIGWHETYKYKCRLDASVCNNIQRWNKDKSRCECKELIDKGICDTVFIWTPSNYECECNKSRDARQYLG